MHTGQHPVTRPGHDVFAGLDDDEWGERSDSDIEVAKVGARGSSSRFGERDRVRLDDVEEIDENDILIEQRADAAKFGDYGLLDDDELTRAQELMPHSKAHRDGRLADGVDAGKVPHDPDGVDHSVIGMIFGCAIMIAILVAVLVATGSWAGRIGGVILGLAAIPVLVHYLAERDTASDR